MDKKPADYLHLVAPTDGRDDNKPMLCGLDWRTLYYDQAISIEHVDNLRKENGPYPLCPNCDKVFCEHTAGKEYRIGYTVGNEQENAIKYFDEVFTEADAKQRVTAMRAIDERPGLKGAVINSNYFYERRPCPGCNKLGQLHDLTCAGSKPNTEELPLTHDATSTAALHPHQRKGIEDLRSLEATFDLPPNAGKTLLPPPEER